MKAKQKQTNKTKRQSLAIFLKVVAFLVPLPLYLIFTTAIFPSPNSGFLFLGVIGTLFIGLGLISVTGLFDGLYFGHIITGVTLGIGTLLVFISSLIMYIPAIYSRIDEQHVSFYFLIFSSLIISTLWYIFFRMGITHTLGSRGISKSALNKLSKGWRNYWWYELIHKTYGIGWLFLLNKWFTTLYLAVTSVHLLLGWWDVIIPVTALGTCFLCILNVPMWGLTYFSQGIVRSPETKAPAPVAILGLVFPVAICTALVIYLFEVW